MFIVKILPTLKPPITIKILVVDRETFTSTSNTLTAQGMETSWSHSRVHKISTTSHLSPPFFIFSNVDALLTSRIKDGVSRMLNHPIYSVQSFLLEQSVSSLVYGPFESSSSFLNNLLPSPRWNDSPTTTYVWHCLSS